MFFIVNKTKKVIIIGDLKITLGPRQAIDLDGKVDRFVSNNSKDLKRFVSKGQVEIKRKDIIEKQVSNHILQPKNTIEIDINKMKDEILQGVKDSISDIVKPQAEPNISTKELATMIAGLINQNNSNNGASVVKKSKEDDTVINEEVLADIHSRTINKKMKKIQSGDIEYNTQKTKSNIDDNIIELENLLD